MNGLFVMGVLCFNHPFMMKTMRKSDHTHFCSTRLSLCFTNQAQ